jgi:hypothetical protein
VLTLVAAAGIAAGAPGAVERLGLVGANQTHTHQPTLTVSASAVVLEPVTIIAEGLERTK